MTTKKSLRPILLFIAAFLVFFLLFLIIRLVFEDVDLVAFTRSPVDQSTLVSVTQDAEQVETNSIPGLIPSELNKSLTALNFECTEPQPGELDLYHWVCWKEEANTLREIYFFSRTLEAIDFIDANFSQSASPSDQDAITFLSFVGSLPENTDAHAQMTAWIADTLPKITQTRDLHEANFGDVHYRLYGTSDARSLEVGTLPQ